MAQSMSNADGPDNVQHLLGIVEDKPWEIDRMDDRMHFNPKTPQKKSERVRLFQVLDDTKHQGKPFEYDEGHVCAEDVDSTNGWTEFKAAFRASRSTKEQKEKKRWFKNQASNGDSIGQGIGRDRLWAKERIDTRRAAFKIA